MDFIKFKKLLAKFQTGLLAAVLVTSISVPGYACEKDSVSHSKNQTTYTFSSKDVDKFFSFGKTFLEKFNSKNYNWPTYNELYNRYKSTPSFTPNKTIEPSSTKINTPKPSSSATNTNKPSPTKTNSPKPSPSIANTPKPSSTKINSSKPSPSAANTPKPSPTLIPSIVPGSITPDEKALLDLVNEARVDANLKPLEYDNDLAHVAMMKAKDMVDNKYFSHTSPTYGSPFDMMKSFGIKYGYAGENIAAGYSNVQDVFNGWMNSPGHKANILNNNFTHCGFGIVSGGTYGGKSWVQMFISKP